jgi:fructose-1,6-bisphosphatase I
MLVYTTGKGVNGFTLDPSIGVYCLSHPNIKMPADGRLYSFNEGNYNTYSKGLQKYCDWVKEEDKSTGRPYSCRYIASMVADVHRNLIKGGVFCYPATAGSPDGKLRLLYECNPMAFIVEQAGGIATTGNKRIMEIIPTALHQRVPVIMGSKNMVNKVLEFTAQFG